MIQGNAFSPSDVNLSGLLAYLIAANAKISREALSYMIQPLVVIATDSDFLSLAGPARTANGTTVELSPADYPVTFYTISGEPALLTLARLLG